MQERTAVIETVQKLIEPPSASVLRSDAAKTFHCFQMTQRSRRRIHESRSRSSDEVVNRSRSSRATTRSCRTPAAGDVGLGRDAVTRLRRVSVRTRRLEPLHGCDGAISPFAAAGTGVKLKPRNVRGPSARRLLVTADSWLVVDIVSFRRVVADSSWWPGGGSLRCPARWSTGHGDSARASTVARHGVAGHAGAPPARSSSRTVPDARRCTIQPAIERDVDEHRTAPEARLRNHPRSHPGGKTFSITPAFKNAAGMPRP